MSKKLTKEEFIEKAKQIHGDEYDYSLVDYVNSETKVKIRHIKCGHIFEVTPNNHASAKNKCGCPECYGKKAYTTNEWIEKAKGIHGNKYDYSNVQYINAKTKVCIICPEHGEFWQSPRKHISGQGCPKCENGQRLTQEEYIKRVMGTHGDKYDYSKIVYVNSLTDVDVICHKHGAFKVNARRFLNGQGCPKCHSEETTPPNRHAVDDVVKMSRGVHGDKYEYCHETYKNMLTPFKIICPEHGEFWQTPAKHIHSRQGCPKCNNSKLEEEISLLLNIEKVNFDEFKHFDWLGKQHLDFYLPECNIAIECQGRQHYEPVSFTSDKTEETMEGNLEEIRRRDKRKMRLCKENGVNLIYFTHYGKVKEDGINIFKNTEKLIEYVKHIDGTDAV